MAMSKAATVAEYLAELPADRRKEIAAARALVRKHMPKGYKEAMGYGMITWTIPLSTYTNTYNKQPLCYAALAAQKNCRSSTWASPACTSRGSTICCRSRCHMRRAHQGTVNRPSFTQTWPFTETVRSVKKFQRT